MEGIAPPSTAWLPVYRLGKSINLAAWLPFSRGREQGAGGMRVRRALANDRSCLPQVNHHLG